ncbi:MAG: AAA family ATPase, partial [Candidatus Woesearchaeota archaeon]
MVPWTKKYAPKSSKELSGQDPAIQQIRDFILNFKKQKKKAMLLYGPSGTGKTSAVHAIAKENNLEIVEVNASDTRNSEQILAVLGNAIKQQSLFSKGKVILVDEVDGIAGQQDRGGVQALAKLIEKPAFPVILAANNPWDNKFSSLRSKTTMVQFMALDYLTIYRQLKRICAEEKIKAEDDLLKNIARRSGGDMRSAINDLQSMGEISAESVQELSDRDRTESVMQALMKVFKTTQPDIALPAF